MSEYHRDGKGVDLQELSRLSLDTHGSEVVGVYGTLPTDIRTLIFENVFFFSFKRKKKNVVS